MSLMSRVLAKRCELLRYLFYVDSSDPEQQRVTLEQLAMRAQLPADEVQMALFEAWRWGWVEMDLGQTSYGLSEMGRTMLALVLGVGA